MTTHVLDTALGRPASGVQVVLERRGPADVWTGVGSGRTDSDGRLTTLVSESRILPSGIYRLVFETRQYFAGRGTSAFYPFVVVVFELNATEPHYHVPLLLSPFGYSTYRGS